MRTPIAPNGLRRLITARLFSRTQWRIWALAALVLAAYAVNIKLAVLYNDWNGRFFNALQAVNKAAIFGELFYFIGLAAAIIILLVWAGYIKDRLMLGAAPRPDRSFLQTLAFTAKRAFPASRER